MREIARSASRREIAPDSTSSSRRRGEIDAENAVVMETMRERMQELEERIASNSAHVDAAMHRLLTDIREFDLGEGWAPQGAMSCAHWLSWRVGWDLATARERLRVARRLGELPNIDDALGRGVVSYSKVRAMTRVATPANEYELLEMATCATASQLETICRKYQAVQRQAKVDVEASELRYVRRSSRPDGMVHVDMVLRPDEAELLWVAMERAAKEMDEKKRLDRVAGLMTVAQAYVRGDKPNRAPVEVVVTVPRAALTAENASAETPEVGQLASGEYVSAETSRRLACDAGVVEVVEDVNGKPLSVGRKTRTIPAALVRALRKRDAGCRFPGCNNKIFVDGHHMKHWANGGETSLDNIVSLCSFHHVFVHEIGFTVELVEGEPVFRDGKGHPVVEIPSHGPSPGIDAIVAANVGLDIDAKTHQCAWDGARPVHSNCVDALTRWDDDRWEEGQLITTLPSWEEERAMKEAEIWETMGDLLTRCGVTPPTDT